MKSKRGEVSLKAIFGMVAFGILAIYTFIALLPIIWNFGIITTIGFVASCSLAFYKGTVFENPIAIVIIAVSYILTNAFIHALIPTIYENILSKSLLTASIIGLVFLYVYFWGRSFRVNL